MMTKISNNGFTIGDTKVTGPVMVFNQTILLWDPPQYGVGGPDGDVDPLPKDAFDDPRSPFHGWTTEVFGLLNVLEPKPG